VSFNVADIPTLVRSPIGRIIIGHGLRYRIWPLLVVPTFLYRRTLLRRTRLAVVIGSFGKTTTTRALKAVFGLPWRRADAANSHSNLSRALFAIRSSQPVGVLEVGINGPRQMEGYARLLRPDIVVVTSIGSEHNRALGTLESTRHEKAAMVRGLRRDQLVVLNGDDAHVRWMADRTRASVVTFGFGADADVRASDYALEWPRGARFDVHMGRETRRIWTRLIGRHQVYPILAAIAVARACRSPIEQVVQRLETVAPTYGRLEPQSLPNGAWLLRDDIKASMETVDAALDVLAEVPASNKVAVLGDIWDPPGSAAAVYGRLGQRAAGIATRLILVGQSAEWYAAGARRGGLADPAVLHATGQNVARIAAALQGLLDPGAVALVSDCGPYRLDRIPLILNGRPVRCTIERCQVRYVDCPACPMLERGWTGVPGLHRRATAR
jgi:UDP-N-acetylmuramoyl-tripeptide--D-alanyl-D-alanine ligase